MKRFLLFVLTTLLSIGITSAQSPDMFNYQAVARDDQGNVIANQSVGIKVSILQGSASGSVVYEEEHTVTTTEQGVVNLMIGDGSVLSGTFSDIDWKSGTYFLEIGMDETGGTSYSTMGTTQLVSVPYAKYADSSGTSFSGNYNDLSNTPDFTDWDQNVNDDFSGDYSDLSNKLWMNNNDTIFTNGVLGIGTDSITNELTIQGSDLGNELLIRDEYAFLELQGTGANSGITFDSQGTDEGLLFYQPSSGNIVLQQGVFADYNIVVGSSGNVGIKTGSPQEDFDVNGAVRVQDTTVNPEPNRIYGNTTPIAYGFIQGFSVFARETSYGIKSVSSPSNGVYEVTLRNGVQNYPTVSINTYDNSGPEIATHEVNPDSKVITVYIWDTAGNPISSDFSIVVYGLPQGSKKKKAEQTKTPVNQTSGK